MYILWNKKTSVARHIQGQIYSRVCVCECVDWVCVCVRVCNKGCVRAFQNSPTALYSAWKAFQELPLMVTGLGQIKAMSPLSALSRSPRQAPLLSTSPRTLRQRQTSFLFLFPLFFFLLFLLLLFSPSMSHGTCSLKLRREPLNRTAWGERGEANEQRGRTVSLSADGWTDGWRDGWMDGMCKLLPFCFAALLRSRLPKAFSQTHVEHQMGSLSLWALFIWALVLWIPSFSPPVTFFFFFFF